MNRETLDKINDRLIRLERIGFLLKYAEKYSLKKVYHVNCKLVHEGGSMGIPVDKNTFDTFLIEQRGKLKAELKELGYEEG